MAKPEIQFQFLTKVTEGRKISGLLAIPRISRNGNLFLPEELAKLDGQTVPVLFNHLGTPQSLLEKIPEHRIIGSMTVHYDPEKMQLNYTADVDLPDEILKQPLGTSLGAFHDPNSPHICGSQRCYTVPKNLRLVEASIVQAPGIPETTVLITESYKTKQCACKISSDSENSSNSNHVMSDTINEKKEPETVQPVKEQFITADQFTVGLTKLTEAFATQFKNIQQVQLDKLTEALGSIKAVPKQVEASAPVADVPATNAHIDEYKKVVEWFSNARSHRVRELPDISWNIDKDYFMKQWGYDTESDLKKIREDVTYSAPPQKFVRKAIFLPGGRLKVPLRQYCDYQTLSGESVANWYTIGAFDFGSITEGSAPSAVSQTITKVTATPAIRGALQKIKYSQIEDQPFDLISTINMAMVLAGVDDENTDLLDTVYNAISPTNWIRGDGTTVSSDDIATNLFKREAIITAKRLIQAQGYSTEPGNLILALHPKQYTDLLVDSNLATYFGYSKPDSITTGDIERLYGVDIVITDQVHAQDNTTDDQTLSCFQ